MKATIADLHRKDSASLGAAELELVLALIRGRTLHGAAERLNIDASTVFRAIRRLEKALGETLFDRGRHGYVPTPLALDLGAHAERIESQLQEARAAVSGSSGAPTGVLRVTTTDTLLHSLLLPLAARFADLYPGIELELVATNALANLSRREADVAIRATRKPPEHLVGVRLGTLRAAVYASKDYLARGKPYPEGADWIVLDDSLPDHPSQAWRRRHGRGRGAAVRVRRRSAGRDRGGAAGRAGHRAVVPGASGCARAAAREAVVCFPPRAPATAQSRKNPLE
jgi:DNA-binding transcriptional LysR family regulator